MGAARRTLALAALLFGLAAPAPGQIFQELVGVSVSVDTPWPLALGKGYFPFWVELENGGDERRDVSLRAASSSWRGPTKSAEKNVTLDPGERRVLELYAPAFIKDTYSYGSYALVVEVGRERIAPSLGITPSNWDPDLRNVVVFTGAGREPAAAIELSERLKTGELRRASLVLSSGGGTTKSTGKPNVHAVLAPFERMPRSYHGYTSLDAAVVDAREGLPPGEELEAILAWARVGGRVVFLGGGALDALRGEPGIQESLEDRFEIREELGAGRAFTFGLGVLLFGDMEGGLIEGDWEIAVVRRALWPDPAVELQSGWVPQIGPWRLHNMQIKIPGVGRIPRRAFMVLLFAFGLVIGPANFWLLKRLGRPGLLLVTIPACSVAFSLGLLAYGIVHQGVDVKTASRTLTVLDQRTHRAATVEHRSIFVGLSPGAGLRPESGTAVFPETIRDQADRYRVSFDEGVLLGGSYLPVRDPVTQVLLSERAARARLGVRVDGAQVSVQNAFETALEEVYVRDENGTWHGVEEHVAPGATVRLGGIQEDDELRGPGELPRGLAAWNPMLAGRSLPPSTYLVVLARSPFADDCTLELNELEGRHAVLGILPEKAEDWE